MYCDCILSDANRVFTAIKLSVYVVFRALLRGGLGGADFLVFVVPSESSWTLIFLVVVLG